MKSIFLSVVIICALAIAGMGGTLATWSDSETSMDNYIETGSVDLMVNETDDLPWGTGVPQKVFIECMVPCKWYGPYYVDLWNAGQCETASEAYIHIKNAFCSNIPAKAGSGYECPETGIVSPEPELVAQYGGKVNCTEVPGIGRTGDDCSMRSHIEMIIVDDAGNIIVEDKMINLICQEIYLFDLVPCEPRTIELWFHLQQESEEYYGLDLIPDEGDAGYDPMHWAKFNDWPSWALMKDKIQFNMEFDLVLWDDPKP
jgi:predicted ribosomally synthesized peptide with SipW-like signal peptide